MEEFQCLGEKYILTMSQATIFFVFAWNQSHYLHDTRFPRPSSSSQVDMPTGTVAPAAVLWPVLQGACPSLPQNSPAPHTSIL